MLISLIFFNQPSLLMEKSSSSFYAINPGELRASKVIEGDRALLFVCLFVCLCNPRGRRRTYFVAEVVAQAPPTKSIKPDQFSAHQEAISAAGANWQELKWQQSVE